MNLSASLMYPLSEKYTPSIPVHECPLPDWVKIHTELRRKGVTLFLLWQEYKAAYPEGFQYSRFCELYRHWTGKLALSMRQGA